MPVGRPTNNNPLSASQLFRDSRPLRRPSLTGISKAKESPPVRCFPFNFDLASGRQPGQALPPTFSTSALIASGTRGRAFVEKAEVSYKVTAIWEPSDGFENRALWALIFCWPLFVFSIGDWFLCQDWKFPSYSNATSTLSHWIVVHPNQNSG